MDGIEPTLLCDGLIVSLDEGESIYRGDILINENRIVEIGKSIKASDARKVNCSHLILLPGLIQSHTHLCQTLFRGLADDLQLLPWLQQKIWPLEAGHDADSMRLSARLGIGEMLKSGTTTIQDMGSVRHYDEVFAEAATAGIRLSGGKCMMDLAETVPDFLLENRKESIAVTEALIEAWHGCENGRLRYSVAPRFAVSCTKELLTESAELGRQNHCNLHTHASENRDEIALVNKQTGQTNINYLQKCGYTGDDVTLAHCIWVDDQEMKTLQRTKTSVAHCPASNLKLASGIAPIVDLLRHEICVSLGTDGAPCNNNHDMFFEMRLAALLQKPRYGADAITAKDVLKMATVGGAKALNLQNEIGSLAVGKKADIIGLRSETLHSIPGDDIYSRIVYSMSGHDVEFTMVDGRFLMRSRELLTIDEEAVIAAVPAALKRVTQTYMARK